MVVYQNNPRSNEDALTDVSGRVLSDDDLRVYKYVPREYDTYTEPPLDVDYVTGLTTRLHSKRTMVDGEITRIDYFESASGVWDAITYTNLVVREDFVYTRSADGFALTRTQTITWYRVDDAPHAVTKERLKIYEPDESMEEGQERRSNISDKTAMEVAAMLIATETTGSNQDRMELGRQLWKDHYEDFGMFVDTSKKDILNSIYYDTRGWLSNDLAVMGAPGVTIKAYILGKINIWGVAVPTP